MLFLSMGDAFTKKLYSTYLSYLPADKFGYPLKMNVDERGSFTEIIRTPERGQFSVNIVKPGIIKGQHWHHTKNEKFLTVSGKGVIRFRDMRNPDSRVIEYYVSGDKMEVIDIPTGYTHNIENLGDTDMITFIWCNECFEKKGVLRDENDDDSVIPQITRAEFEQYVADGVIQGGMIPKLENSFEAINAGVSEVVITLASAINNSDGTRIKK